jgi:AraC-like DNA-binding protein
MTHASHAALRTWSTAHFPREQRLDYWVGAVCEGFLEMTVSAVQPAPFDAELQAVPLDGLVVNGVRGSAQRVYRSPAAIARGRQDYYYLLCKGDANWGVVQAGRDERLLPTDLVLIDSRRPYELHFPHTVDALSLQLPIPWVESWIASPQRQLARRIDGQSAWGQVLSTFVRQLQPPSLLQPALPAALLADQVGALFALAASPDPSDHGGATTADAALRARIDDQIRQRCSEPGLTAEDVASGLQISSRTLHRCLAAGEWTFASRLMAHRMDLARRMLSCARFDRLTVAEIGRRCGLLDPSHFARVCRRLLGATPAELRARR